MLNLPPPDTTRKRKPASYKITPADTQALKELKALNLQYINANYTVDYPESFIHPYVINTANGLTRCVIDWLKFDGQQGENIKVKGTMVDGTKVVTDVMGSRRIVGSVSYQKSTMTKGSADISGVIEGRAIRVEIKINSDRQSSDQKDYQHSVERAKGVYVIIKTLSGWRDWYQQFKSSLTVQKELF